MYGENNVFFDGTTSISFDYTNVYFKNFAERSASSKEKSQSLISHLLERAFDVSYKCFCKSGELIDEGK